jgi:hypothetical protein
MSETLLQTRTPEAIYAECIELDPRVVKALVPSNGTEQKKAFLAGDITAPQLNYDQLEDTDFAARAERYDELEAEIGLHPGISDNYKPACYAALKDYRSANRLLWVSKLLQDARVEGSDTAELDEEFRRLNRDLYGEVDKQVYGYFIKEAIENLQVRGEDPVAQRLLDELREMVAGEYDPDREYQIFQPSEQTVTDLTVAAKALYEPLLQGLPRKGNYPPTKLAAALGRTLKNRMGGAADSWTSTVEPVTYTEVNAADEHVSVPQNRKEATAMEARELKVHELGVHVLRALMGKQTDFGLFGVRIGLNVDTEEGLATIMQLLIKGGKYTVPGGSSYRRIGYMDSGHTFKETQEMVWRLNVLQAHTKKGEPIDGAAIQKAQSTAYDVVDRTARGTGRLPLHKDLAYYHGPKAVWRYFERYGVDELTLGLAMLGKYDISSQVQRRAALETKTP